MIFKLNNKKIIKNNKFFYLANAKYNEHNKNNKIIKYIKLT